MIRWSASPAARPFAAGSLHHVGADRAGESEVLKLTVQDGTAPTGTANSAEQYEFPAEVDVLTIGRAAGNQIIVDNPHVSALHGQITLRQGRYVFQDLQSTNGSAVQRGDEKTVLDGESLFV